MEPDLPSELAEVAQTLETDGPRMTEPEFARVRRTVLQRTTSRRRTVFTRSRLAITSMLTVGALMSTGGVALGVSALSTDLTARAAQYGAPTSTATPTAGTLAGSSNPDGTSPTAGSGDATTEPTPPVGGVAGVAAAEDSDVAQAPAQLKAVAGGELPFTGYLAIPLLLAGLVMLAAGLVLRRNGRSTTART
ncbi:MAG: hypothetical protein ACR2LK_03150 [Solirubrobacteraceae bacterium]